MITKIPFHNGEYDWININIDNPSELKKFYDAYNIDDEIVAYSLDRNERARLEYEAETNTFALFFNVPNNEKIDDHYETVPMTFLIKGSQFITVTNGKNQYIADKMKRFLDKNDGKTIFEFLFSSLFLITDTYFPFVEEMDADRKMINDKLKEKTTKQNLLSLSDLETGIVYFVSASKQNLVLLEQVKTHIIYRTLNASEKEQFEDAVIEAKQLVEMTKLSSQILQQLSGTYNNILNNNLNDTIKILTVLSILLTIPTIITGFFGMNMPLPLEHNSLGWVTTILISVVVWFVLAYVLRRLLRR
ncbi:magnesium transporter CorA family protein [Paenilisteria rocourtiae]|uniref:Mg2+ and Co2+ transporter CorA n=1 Tax=Listeria rocourtiae TaxID=647910 RepID=A0A4R6ZQD4_9LIST|nr:magnesium transporter CorA family protein [Listeria rocourtiae]EUJ48461.1 CorA family magnesium transporter [Listeria rocourtiae FSL F6-920]TDR54823.1 Mg2+ and Co2+ transporter CorA [Listeria rocourtiae]